jgi:mannose-6-phosphate isomerase-like protein (cupin superfamily)
MTFSVALDEVGQNGVRAARGRRAGLRVWSLDAGQAEDPHVHAAEQIGHVLAGTLQLTVVRRDGDRHAVIARAGDFYRVPPMTVHWTATDEGCSVVEYHTPALAGHELTAPWEPPAERPAPTYRVSAASYANGASAVAEELPGTLVRADAVPVHAVHNPDGSDLTTQVVFGQRASVMVGSRPDGYHSRPHVHDCEQVNVVVAGRLEGYVVDPDGGVHGSLLGVGDVWRVPTLAPHWIYNRGGEPCRLVEVHAPGLHGDPLLQETAVALIGPDEPPPPPGDARNIYVELDAELVEQAERTIGPRS